MSTVFQTLTDTVYDSVEGYRKAHEKANDPSLKAALSERLMKRERTLAAMKAVMARNGEELMTKGTVTGDLHRMWMGIADLFENGDEAAAERVEEGEDYLKKKFEAALEHDNLDAIERDAIASAYNEICEGERFGNAIAAQHD